MKSFYKMLSVLITIILLFSFCPLAMASDFNDNLLNPNMSTWYHEYVGFINSVDFVGGVDKQNVVSFLPQSSNDFNLSLMYSLTGDILSDKDYQLTFDFLTYQIQPVSFDVYLWVVYSDHSTEHLLYTGGKNNTYPNYLNIKVNFKPVIDNDGYNCYLVFMFGKNEGTALSAGSYCNINNLNLVEIESKESNILKRIYNFIIDLPSTIQSFLIDLKTNLTNMFSNLKDGIGDFFVDLGDNISSFFITLKNYLLYFSPDGASVYVNPFDSVHDDDKVNLNSIIATAANYIDDKGNDIVQGLNNLGSVFLVLDTFVTAIPLLLVLISLAFFIHIFKRILGY